MQPCSPALRARPFWRDVGALNGFGSAISTTRPKRLRRTEPAEDMMRMTETTKNSGEKLSVSSTKTLTLKRGGVEQGVVRQSFSHGRSKAVVVEKVKRRVAGPGEVKPETVTPADRGAAPKRGIASAKSPAIAAAAAAPMPVSTPGAPKSSGVVLRTLTEEE